MTISGANEAVDLGGVASAGGSTGSGTSSGNTTGENATGGGTGSTGTVTPGSSSGGGSTGQSSQDGSDVFTPLPSFAAGLGQTVAVLGVQLQSIAPFSTAMIRVTLSTTQVSSSIFSNTFSYGSDSGSSSSGTDSPAAQPAASAPRGAPQNEPVPPAPAAQVEQPELAVDETVAPLAARIDAPARIDATPEQRDSVAATLPGVAALGAVAAAGHTRITWDAPRPASGKQGDGRTMARRAPGAKPAARSKRIIHWKE